jgi:hypothetical protein
VGAEMGVEKLDAWCFSLKILAADLKKKEKENCFRRRIEATACWFYEQNLILHCSMLHILKGISH